MSGEFLGQGGLSLDRLQSFCMVAEAGGVTKAAKGNPARQSLFSRQVKELEEFFGTELVQRMRGSFALTAAGQRLQMLAKCQLVALSDFKRSLSGQTVQITIAAGDSMLQWVMLPRFQLIEQRLPGFSFRIINLSTSQIAEQLRAGTVDLAIIRRDRVRGRCKQGSPEERD